MNCFSRLHFFAHSVYCYCYKHTPRFPHSDGGASFGPYCCVRNECARSSSPFCAFAAPYIPEICAAPGITQDQLALRLHVNRSNVTRQLAMLEENGFVLRRRSESDRRAVEVYPTQKAEETLSAVRAVYRSWREKLFYDLTSEERDRLESLLERLARRAEDIQ